MHIPVVDWQDKIIGSKERDEVDFKNDIFRTASLWITNSAGGILLAQRKMDKKTDPGKWAEAVGGTVEGNDDYEATMLREAYEELGMQNITPQLGPKQLITTPCHYFVQWYTVQLDAPIESFTIQPEEVEQIAWIPYSQLKKELQTEPKKYIAAMPEIVALFKTISKND